jgi:hypothetical protein
VAALAATGCRHEVLALVAVGGGGGGGGGRLSATRRELVAVGASWVSSATSTGPMLGGGTARRGPSSGMTAASAAVELADRVLAERVLAVAALPELCLQLLHDPRAACAIRVVR